MLKPIVFTNNFVEENIKKVSLWKCANERSREKNSLLFRERREKAIEKRKKLFFNRIRNSMFYMKRWDIVREKRKDMQMLEKKEERKALFKFWWIRQIYSQIATKAIFSSFNQARSEILIAIRVKIYAKRIMRRFQRMAR